MIKHLGKLIDWLKPESTLTGIYAIVIDNCGIYIGKSKNIEERLKSHAYAITSIDRKQGMRAPRFLQGSQKIMQEAYVSGLDIRCLLIEECNEKILDEREQFYIELLISLGYVLINRGPDGSSLTDWLESRNE